MLRIGIRIYLVRGDLIRSFFLAFELKYSVLRKVAHATIRFKQSDKYSLQPIHGHLLTFCQCVATIPDQAVPVEF